jgi:hypothetical protein
VAIIKHYEHYGKQPKGRCKEKPEEETCISVGERHFELPQRQTFKDWIFEERYMTDKMQTSIEEATGSHT